jgi:hypothetical protein
MRSDSFRNRGRVGRRGIAALEVVLASIVVLPMALVLYLLTEQALQALFFVVGNAVGWPFL